LVTKPLETKKYAMKQKLMLFGLACLSFNANAATIVQTATINNGPAAPTATFPLTTPFVFNQFDPALGTLNSVTLEIVAESGADVSGDNQSGSEANFRANLVGSVAGTIPVAPSVNTTVNLSATVGPVLVAASNEAGAGGADFLGTDSAEFLNVNDSGNDTDGTTLPAELLAFVGLGTLNGQVVDTQGWSVTGGGDAVTQVANSRSITTWRVIYDYNTDIVPEPSSALLSMIGALALLRRRR